VGLGNPGRAYQDTRHNLGWMVLEWAARRWGVVLSQRGLVLQGQGTVQGHSVALAIPQTWMNQTGVVVSSVLQGLRRTTSDLIVVYDDLDLPLGALKIKTRGRAGGHNGLRSVLSSVGSEDFCRLKVGIGRPPGNEELARYVLSPFSSEEYKVVDVTLPKAVDALECLICEGPEAAMNRFHVRSDQPEMENGEE